MKISGAIFDMDGTLTDSMFVWMDIGRRYLISCGITPRETLLEEIKNMSMWQVSNYFMTEYGLKKTHAEIYEGIDSLVEPMYRDEVFPKDGVFLLLDLFKSQGVKMCVASATDRQLVEMVLKKNGLFEYFSEIFTCNSVGAGKDEPLIYEKALEHLGTPKEETLVFEDAFFSIKTAKSAGFTVVGVYDASAERFSSEIKSLVDYYITDYRRDYLMF